MTSLVPLAEVAAVYFPNRSKTSIYRWARQGAIPTVKIGGSVYMHQSDIDALVTPSGQAAAEIAARRAEGTPLLSSAQLELVRRAFDETLTRLAQGEL